MIKTTLLDRIFNKEHKKSICDISLYLRHIFVVEWSLQSCMLMEIASSACKVWIVSLKPRTRTFEGDSLIHPFYEDFKSTSIFLKSQDYCYLLHGIIKCHQLFCMSDIFRLLLTLHCLYLITRNLRRMKLFFLVFIR